jgi:hypothetical protein
LATVIWADGSDALWRAIEERGWMATRERVVVHVGDDARARAAARALIGLLRRGAPGSQVRVIDAVGSGWGDVPVVDLDAEPRWTLDAVRLRGGVDVPALWLESFALVRVVAPSPDPRLGVSAVLASAATLLADRGRDLDRIYEAHRLLAADVNVAVGDVTFGAPGSGEWWAASDGDLALEEAIALASGRPRGSLPALRHVARHELVDAEIESLGSGPALRGHLAAPARVWASRLAEETRHAARTVGDDLRAATANLHRAPGFVRKHLRRAEA